MFRYLKIAGVHIRIWEKFNTAPISEHPKRLARQHPHRQFEFDAIAAIIPEPWSWSDIGKENLGKPYLIDRSHHIGISHSNGFACFGWSFLPFGIDIQTPHQSIFKVREKYCHPLELTFLSDDPTDIRHLMLWSAKEAIYKYYGHGIDFSQDLIASPFSSHDSTIHVECKFSKNKSTTFIVDFIHHDYYILSLATKKNEENL